MHEPRERLHIPARRLSIVFGARRAAGRRARPRPRSPRATANNDGPRVVITGRVTVGAQERTDSVVIFDGPAVDQW